MISVQEIKHRIGQKYLGMSTSVLSPSPLTSYHEHDQRNYRTPIPNFAGIQICSG